MDPRLQRRLSISLILAFSMVLASASRPATVVGAPGQAPAVAGGLETLFDVGGFLQDRNDDGFVDFVDAALVVADNRSDTELAAAVDVAARLGFETMAMNLPLTAAEGAAVGIAIGAGGVERAGLSVERVATLEPGEGIVRRVSEGGRDWIVIVGADDDGTRAAAHAFAGWLPRVGSPDGATLAELIEQARGLLAGEGIEVSGATVDEVVVFAEEPESLASVEVEIGLTSDADLDAAAAVLAGVPDRRAAAQEDSEAPEREAGAEVSEDGDEVDSEARLLSFPGARLVRFALSGPAAVAVVEVPRVEPDPPSGPVPARPGAGGKDDVDLSNLFEPSGLLGDSDGNEIPDRIDAVLSATGPGSDGVIDLAARLGLESAGITLPLGRVPDTIDRAGAEPTMVVIGVEHPLIEELIEEDKIDAEALGALEPGEGWIEVVPDAFDGKRALVVTGADAAGLERALEQLSVRFPNLSERGKDRPTVDDLEQAAWRFLSQRSPGGQAAAALYKLDRMVEELSGETISSARVTVSLEKIDAGIESFVRDRLAALGIDDLQVVLDDRDVQNAAVLMDEEIPIPSEVEAFWRVLRDRVIPAVDRGDVVRVEARLSEPPEVRARIAEQALGELEAAGADATASEVVVLSAFKQGFSWLREVVTPELRRLREERGLDAIGGVRINFAENQPPPDWPQQAIYSKVRWLKEAWPIDEVMAEDLGVELELIDFEMAPPDAPTYEVVATDRDGGELFRRTFEPKWVLAPHYERFDDYEMVRVTTGWIHATAGDRTLADERIVTEIEQFWNHYQTQTLPAIYDYVMDRSDGLPRSADAPFFGELEVEVSLSEPDYMLGIDNEYISSLDSLHEEVYFPTLFFFRLLGRMARGDELTSIGRVIPVMRPRSDGEPGWAKVRFTGFATSRPAVVIDWVDGEGRKRELRRDVPPVEMERPAVLAAKVRAGEQGIAHADVRVKVDFREDDRADLLNQADEYRVDTSIMTAAQAVAVIENLAALRAAGAYPGELALHGLGTVRLAAGWEWEIGRESRLLATLPGNGSAQPLPRVADLLPEGSYTYEGEPLVQWETPIPPPEGHAILARMATFPEATVYRVGHSYLGKDIWAMDLMSPIEASHWSHYKATTFKPTVVYSAREHANEVSSTSHVLKLAELLLTDPEFGEKLRDVNVVIHPFTNPDGAQLAYDLYRITPDFILHAGYLGSLGQGATSGGDEPMPLYPEARVRPRLWQTWLPDVFLNPHGYPSHEVVQLFSGYAGLVRQGRITERNWSVNRGWFLPGFGYLDDPDFPEHKAAAFRIRDYITRYINEAENVRALNERTYDRYRRYGKDFEPVVYRQDLVDGVNIQMPLKGSRAGGDFRGGFNPRVTIWSGNTEAPDETAHGEWMELVATAGLQWDKAILDYLYEGDHRVEREGSSFWGGGVRIWRHRPRPAKVEETDEEAESGPSEPAAASR